MLISNFLSKITKTNRNYLKSFTWMMAENILRIVLGLVVSIYIVRYLGPKDYGILSYAVSFTGILSPIATLGIDAVLLRNIILDKKNEKVLLHTSRVLKFSCGLILSFLTIVYAYFFIDDVNLVVSIIILMIGISFNSFNVYKEYIVAINKMKLIAFAGIISLLVANFYRIGLLVIEAGVIWFAFAISLTQIINIISLKYYYSRISDSGNIYFSYDLAKKLLNDSWPLIFTSFTGTLFIYADQILIEFFFDFEEVGIYAAAVRLIIYFTVIPSVISNMIYPKVIEIFKANNKIIFENKMKEIYFYNFLLSALIVLFIYVFGKQLILIFYGDPFFDSIQILKIYSLSLFFIFYSPMNNKLLMIENLQKLMLFRNVIGLIINLILNYYFIPSLGIIGAVYSTLISQLIILFSYLLDRRTQHIFQIQIGSILYPFTIIKNLNR